jgi:hypothetical protein
MSAGAEEALDTVATAGEKIITDIQTAVSDAIDKIGGYAEEALKEVEKLFGIAWDAIKDAANVVWEGVVVAAEAVVSVANDAADAAVTYANAAADAAVVAGDVAVDVANKLAQGLDAAGNVIAGGIADVGSGIVDVGNDIGDGASDAWKTVTGCFSVKTPIKLLDGRVIPMKDVKIGDVLINESKVRATMQIQAIQDDPFYRIYSEDIQDYIYVTGSHHIKDGDKYILVSNCDKCEKLDTVDNEVSCFVTSDHMIPVGEFTFWDWEDNLL